MSIFSGCPGAVTIREAEPEDIQCTKCDAEVEIWSDELSARCTRCGTSVSREQGPTCIDWCSFAEECVGTEKYQHLKGEELAQENE